MNILSRGQSGKSARLPDLAVSLTGTSLWRIELRASVRKRAGDRPLSVSTASCRGYGLDRISYMSARTEIKLNHTNCVAISDVADLNRSRTSCPLSLPKRASQSCTAACPPRSRIVCSIGILGSALLPQDVAGSGRSFSIIHNHLIQFSMIVGNICLANNELT